MTSKSLRIILVDDHAVVRTGYKLLLENESDIEVVAELESGEQANQQARELNPDVIIMDLSMPGMGGLEAIRRIKAKNPEIKILVFSMHDNVSFVEHAMEAGASGYITKNNAPNILIHAVNQIAEGNTYIEPALESEMNVQHELGKGSALSNLSHREFQIFCLFAEGLNANDIANDLSLSVKTVANYQTQIKEKLNVSSTTELVKLAITNGIIEI
ncbi:MAG: response regulator transcription factor [Gammaproteobacteria bacterium]|nr:response regulator transcription factor [Gammaproteobacteria bacterium]